MSSARDLDIGSSCVVKLAPSLVALMLASAACRHRSLLVSTPRLARAAVHASAPGHTATAETVAPRSERWRTGFEIEAHLVADLGDTLLVRNARTSDDVTFSLFDARDGHHIQTLSWMSTALPLGQRTHTHRFSFSGSLVAVSEGEPAQRTTVRDLLTGAARWSAPAPATVQLRARGSSIDAFVVGRQGSAVASVERRDAMTGVKIWSDRSTTLYQRVIALTDATVLTFESASPPAFSQRGAVVARAAISGQRRWTLPLIDSDAYPIRAVPSGESLWLSSETALLRVDESTGRVSTRRALAARVRALSLTNGTLIVNDSNDAVAAFSATDGQPLWSRERGYHCIRGGAHGVLAVSADAIVQELDANSGAVLFERGWGDCGWEFEAHVRDRPRALLIARPNLVRVLQPSAAREAPASLRVVGAATLDGAPLRAITVSVADRSTVTDDRGQFAIDVSVIGSFVLVIDERELHRRAHPRCPQRHAGEVTITHDGRGGERSFSIELTTFARNPLTGCSPM